MRKLNNPAKLSFFRHRRKSGDLVRLSEQTGYSLSHLSNVVSGTRRVNSEIANAMYSMTRRRVKREEFINA